MGSSSRPARGPTPRNSKPAEVTATTAGRNRSKERGIGGDVSAVDMQVQHSLTIEQIAAQRYVIIEPKREFTEIVLAAQERRTPDNLQRF